MAETFGRSKRFFIEKSPPLISFRWKKGEGKDFVYKSINGNRGREATSLKKGYICFSPAKAGEGRGGDGINNTVP